MLALGIVSIIIYIIVTPLNIPTLSSHSRPTQNYLEAAQRIEKLRDQEPGGMNPVCQLQFMSHEKAMDRAIVLVHGYTNCPQQFHELGKRFYDLGYNVLIAPLPHHGLADRMTDAHGQLTAEELAAFADDTVDIAQGLGKEVVMMGFSAGGTATAWAAQTRNDIYLAVIIPPVFGFKQIPVALTAAAMNISSFLPDSYEWWDPHQQTDIPPAYAYPRYSIHALAQTLRLGFAIQLASNRISPLAKRIKVVLNANDNAVNNGLTKDVVKNWRAHDTKLTTYEFTENLKLGHDLIDPNQPDAQIEKVYPRLIELVNR
jgi:pimeloyl-ACP methyl ester carboxylesterase